MSQSWFSLGFLSQNSLWKLSTFREYKGIYSKVREECEKSFFCKIGHFGDSFSRLEWVVSLSRKTTIRPDYTFCLVVLQLSWPFSFLHTSHMWHFGKLLVVRSNHENLLNAHTLEFLHTLSHTTLTLFSPKYRVSNISWNYKQIWHGIEPTHDWINSTLQLILRNLSQDALSFHSSSLYINNVYQECFVLYL